MKKSILLIFLLIMVIGLVSAQNSLSDVLNQIDQSMVILSAIFLISFSILFFAFSKSIFRDNRTIAGMVSSIVAFLITYGLNKTGFDFEGLFYGIGISERVLMTIIPIIILAGMIFVIVKLKSGSLLVFGGLFILLSFFVYEKTFLIVIGVILLIIGLIFISRKKKKGDIIIKK